MKMGLFYNYVLKWALWALRKPKNRRPRNANAPYDCDTPSFLAQYACDHPRARRACL